MDLNAPLGLDPPPKPRDRRILIFCACTALIGLCALGAYVASTEPRVRGSFAVATIPPQILVPRAPPPHPSNLTSPSSDTAPDPSPTGSLAQPARTAETAPSEAATMEHGVKVVRAAPQAGADRGASGVQGPLIIDVTRALDGGRHVVKPAPSGMVTPDPAPAHPPGPQIALFVEGMGLSETATRTALESMPPAVDFAFVPYGATVAALVASAKAKGHEILLQLPMESGRGGSFGPHMLRPGESAADFASDMAWLTGQFSGYAGMTNLLGAPVTADPATMGAILKDVGARALFYVDDGTSRRSLAPSLAAKLGVAVVTADVVLDATSDKDKVRANLDDLVAIAKRKGSAIGMATGLPNHLGTIAKFAADLGAQGVTLVSVSALAAHPVATAAAK